MDAPYLNQQAVIDPLTHVRQYSGSWRHSDRRICLQRAYVCKDSETLGWRVELGGEEQCLEHGCPQWHSMQVISVISVYGVRKS